LALQCKLILDTVEKNSSTTTVVKQIFGSTHDLAVKIKIQICIEIWKIILNSIYQAILICKLSNSQKLQKSQLKGYSDSFGSANKRNSNFH